MEDRHPDGKRQTGRREIGTPQQFQRKLEEAQPTGEVSWGTLLLFSRLEAVEEENAPESSKKAARCKIEHATQSKYHQNPPNVNLSLLVIELSDFYFFFFFVFFRFGFIVLEEEGFKIQLRKLMEIP